MKARATLTKSELKKCREYVESMEQEYASRYTKLTLYALNTIFGFSAPKCRRLYEEMEGFVDKMAMDPIFWDNLDKQLIDKLKLPLPRENYEMMESLFYKEPEKKGEDKKSISELHTLMCTVREFNREAGNEEPMH